MATISWIGGTGNSFNTAADWSTGLVPGSSDTALINLAGAVVVSSQSNTVASLAIASTATLDSTAGTFSVSSGTATGGIAGTLIVGDNTNLQLGGAIVNSGTIAEQSTADATRIILTSATVALSGGGQLMLSANANNYIYGASGSDLLDNVNNIISGSGNLGDGQMTLTNELHGTIDANQSVAALVLNTSSNTIVNHGLMEATAAGNLVLDSTVLNTGATIEASGAGSTVTLANDVIGGTLKSLTGGVFVSAGGSGQLDGQSSHAVTVAGVLNVADNTSFSIAGTINNTGTIALGSNPDNTNLIVDGATTTAELTGGGKVVLSNSSNNRIYGANGNYTLWNLNNTISGAGQLGLGQLKIINAGTINANQATSLTVYPSYGLTNTGLLEATGTGGLTLQNYVDNAGGTILATGTGDVVTLNGADIQGGTLATTVGGQITAVSGAELDGYSYGQIVSSGTVAVADNNSLYLQGTIDNTGTLLIASGTANDTTNLIVNSQIVTLTGAGTVAMTDEFKQPLLCREWQS